MTLVGLLLALVIGGSLGLLGGGGSILTVPVFVYVLGFGAKEAVAASLAVVGVASLFGPSATSGPETSACAWPRSSAPSPWRGLTPGPGSLSSSQRQPS